MKKPQDLCRVEYILYRRQMRQIHRLARDQNQRPSEFLRLALDHVLAIQDRLESHDK